MRRMSLRLSIAVLLSTILLIPPNLLAWGVEGHKAIAIIAANRLKGTHTAQRISDLLGSLTLADIAVCPDEVRALEQHNAPLSPVCATIFPDPPKGTANWHFVDIPVKSASFNPTTADVNTACNSECVLVQIDRFLKVLADAKPSDTDDQKLAERQALSFVVHFIGDVHQPLHAADRNNDHGGNGEHIQFFGSDSQHHLVLHSIWDTGIVSRIDANETQLASDLKPQIDKAAQEPAAQPMDWALQAYRFARDVAYKGIRQPNSDPNVDVAKLGQKYQKSAAPVVRQQLARAGVRLAEALQANLK